MDRRQYAPGLEDHFPAALGHVVNRTRVTSRREREREKVSAKSLGRAGCCVGRVKQSAEFLARAENLSPARSAPSRVGGGQVEQLERPRLRVSPPRHVASTVRPNCALDLATHVRELVDERQLGPPSGGAGMDDGFFVRHRAPAL